MDYRSFASGATSFVQNRTILVVEDDDDMRKHVMNLLSERKMHVIEAIDLATAIASLDEHRKHISVVLIDIELPDGLGIDLLRACRERKMPCGVIIMTGHGTMEHAIAALKHGAADFLTKPFATRDLDEALRRALRQSM